jgi:hypothetical protein
VAIRDGDGDMGHVLRLEGAAGYLKVGGRDAAEAAVRWGSIPGSSFVPFTWPATGGAEKSGIRDFGLAPLRRRRRKPP